jgi:hypothetical protein
MDDIEKRIVKIESWKNGNGAKGAEQRLQIVEEFMSDMKLEKTHFMTDEATDKMVQAAVSGFISAAQNKDKTFVAKVRAFSPYFATIGAVVAAMLAALKP